MEVRKALPPLKDSSKTETDYIYIGTVNQGSLENHENAALNTQRKLTLR